MKYIILAFFFIITFTNVNAQDYSYSYGIFTNQSLEEIKAVAKTEKKNYYIDFTAEWCYPCKVMEQTTFKNYDVINYSLNNYLALKLEISDFDAIELQQKHNVQVLPSILFFDYNGNLISKTTGSMSSEAFLNLLKEITQKSTQFSMN